MSNCFGMCLAKITGLPVEMFAILAGENYAIVDGGMCQNNVAMDILKANGFVQVSLHALPTANVFFDNETPFVLEVANYNGKGHSVVCENGKIIYDPACSNPEQPEPRYYEPKGMIFVWKKPQREREKEGT